jgi:hypothetical protein
MNGTVRDDELRLILPYCSDDLAAKQRRVLKVAIRLPEVFNTGDHQREGRPALLVFPFIDIRRIKWQASLAARHNDVPNLIPALRKRCDGATADELGVVRMSAH